MSLGNQGVFQLMKMGLFSRCHITAPQLLFVAALLAHTLVFSGYPSANAEEMLEAAQENLAIADSR